jgi:hypothetical protein
MIYSESHIAGHTQNFPRIPGTVKKALRLLGFGLGRLIIAPTDAFGQGR